MPGLMIEIGYTSCCDDEFPSHYGYYDNPEDAKKAIDDIVESIKTDIKNEE